MLPVTNREEVELSLAYLYKFNNRELTIDEFKQAVRLKFFRLCAFYFIKDADGKKVRFCPNIAQTEYYQESHQKNIILKARQLGFTTFQMIHDLDSCLFKRNFSAGCIAHNDKSAKDIYRNKIRFAYQSIKPSVVMMFAKIGYKFPEPVNDKDNGYVFSNGSSIGVSTGFRGGTLQALHISELGKIAKKYPDKAEEIKTGAFPAASGQGATITIESTAEGRAGMFYEYCEVARKILDIGNEPHSRQFKFHFFPWWKDSKYTSEGDIDLPDVLINYFETLRVKHDIELTQGQKVWYYFAWCDQGEHMRREYPSTPEESFAQAIEGAYYAEQFKAIYRDQRIGAMPVNDAPVHTAWDLGVGDSTSIWFWQEINDQLHIIDYYENSGEGMRHYFKVLKDKGYSYGEHYAPHDIAHREFGGDAKSRIEIAMEGFEIDGEIYSVSFNKLDIMRIDEGIELVRETLPRCCFNEKISDTGIRCLESYRKEWNDKLGCWRDRPLHDWSSHGADGFRYLAMAVNANKPVADLGIYMR